MLCRCAGDEPPLANLKSFQDSQALYHSVCRKASAIYDCVSLDLIGLRIDHLSICWMIPDQPAIALSHVPCMTA